MQQKYCDHVRSIPLSKMTCPMCRARSSCGSGKPRNASILPCANSSSESAARSVTQFISWPEPDPGSHGRKEQLRARTQRLYPDGLAFQFGDAADVAAREQFEAAGIDRGDELRGVIRTEIHLAAYDRRHAIGIGGDSM
jgi:hypothetical protein